VTNSGRFETACCLKTSLTLKKDGITFLRNAWGKSYSDTASLPRRSEPSKDLLLRGRKWTDIGIYGLQSYATYVQPTAKLSRQFVLHVLSITCCSNVVQSCS
jgi:hypothetical protein